MRAREWETMNDCKYAAQKSLAEMREHRIIN